MVIEPVQAIFTRNLNRLRKIEIESYSDEKNLWKIEEDIANCAGNLNTYVEKEIGEANYARNSVLEVSSKNVPRTE